MVLICNHQHILHSHYLHAIKELTCGRNPPQISLLAHQLETIQLAWYINRLYLTQHYLCNANKTSSYNTISDAINLFFQSGHTLELICSVCSRELRNLGLYRQNTGYQRSQPQFDVGTKTEAIHWKLPTRSLIFCEVWRFIKHSLIHQFVEVLILLQAGEYVMTATVLWPQPISSNIYRFDYMNKFIKKNKLQAFEEEENEDRALMMICENDKAI